MATSTTKATKASAVASLTPTSFGGANNKFIRYSLQCNTKELKAEFPGYDQVRVTTYIGGHTFIQPGAVRDDSIEPIVFKASEMKKFVAKHNLQDITNNHVFGISRQIVGQKNNPAKLQAYQEEYEASRATAVIQ